VIVQHTSNYILTTHCRQSKKLYTIDAGAWRKKYQTI